MKELYLVLALEHLYYARVTVHKNSSMITNVSHRIMLQKENGKYVDIVSDTNFKKQSGRIIAQSYFPFPEDQVEILDTLEGKLTKSGLGALLFDQKEGIVSDQWLLLCGAALNKLETMDEKTTEQWNQLLDQICFECSMRLGIYGEMRPKFESILRTFLFARMCQERYPRNPIIVQNSSFGIDHDVKMALQACNFPLTNYQKPEYHFEFSIRSEGIRYYKDLVYEIPCNNKKIQKVILPLTNA